MKKSNIQQKYKKCPQKKFPECLLITTINPSCFMKMLWSISAHWCFQKIICSGLALWWSDTPQFDRPGVAGAVLQTPPLLIDWVTQPFPPYIQNIITPKLLELESWNFERMFTLNHFQLSRVICRVSGVRCHLSHFKCNFLYFFLTNLYIEIPG